MAETTGSSSAEIAPGVTQDSALGQAYMETMQLWLTLHSAVPRRLYHYTRVSGLEGILRTKCFWASHAEYLNDASELGYAESLIGEMIADVGKGVERESLRAAMTDRPELASPFIMGERPFVVCFCENGDLLSQWRGYGSVGPAYALGLDLTQQVHFGTLPLGTVLRRVIYDRAEQEKLVRDAVWLWAAAVDKELEAATEEKRVYPYPALWVLQRMLIEMYLCFKNPGFAEEREWRLIKVVDAREEVRHASDQIRAQQMRDQMVRIQEDMRRAGVEWEMPPLHEPSGPSWATRAEGLEVKFRSSSFGFIPYIEMPVIDRAGVFAERLPLWEVVHGPTSHPELALQSLLLYLDAQGYGGHTKVTPSRIPLRPG